MLSAFPKCSGTILGQPPLPPDKTPRTIPLGQPPPPPRTNPSDKTPRTKPPGQNHHGQPPSPPPPTQPDKTPHPHKIPLQNTLNANHHGKTKNQKPGKSKMAFILNSDGFRALFLMI